VLRYRGPSVVITIGEGVGIVVGLGTGDSTIGLARNPRIADGARPVVVIAAPWRGSGGVAIPIPIVCRGVFARRGTRFRREIRRLGLRAEQTARHHERANKGTENPCDMVSHYFPRCWDAARSVPDLAIAKGQMQFWEIIEPSRSARS